MGRHDDIMLIYRWYRSAARRFGIKIEFPEATDPTKTYLYQHLGSFSDFVNKIGLNKQEVRDLVNLALQTNSADRRRIAGASILSDHNLLDEYIEMLRKRSDRDESMLDSIASCRDALQRKGLHNALALASPERAGAAPNIVILAERGVIPSVYLAFSKTAIRAMRMLSTEERQSLPSDRDLSLLRMHLLVNKEKMDALSSILGQDMIKASL